MTAPLFFVASGVLSAAGVGGHVRLDGAEGRHAATVRRIGTGEEVVLSDGAGWRGAAVVESADRGELGLRLRSVEEVAAPDLRFVLVQALAKGERDAQAIEAATELGVDEVVPWQAARSIVVWRPERAARAHAKWESVVLAATKQSRRPRIPVVGALAGQQDVLRRIGAAALALVLQEDASRPLAGHPLPATGDVVLVVGPEGGITPAEHEAFAAAGAVSVRLGDHVLRSSSAGPAALAVLSAATRWR